jgi:hypothetical protein
MKRKVAYGALGLVFGFLAGIFTIRSIFPIFYIDALIGNILLVFFCFLGLLLGLQLAIILNRKFKKHSLSEDKDFEISNRLLLISFIVLIIATLILDIRCGIAHMSCLNSAKYPPFASPQPLF